MSNLTVRSIFAALTFVTAAAPLRAQDSTARLLDSVVSANSRTLQLDNGVLSGDGARFLIAEASRAQFLVLGEQHNAQEVPQLTTALFRALQPSGYEYLADEQDPVALRWVSSIKSSGTRDSVAAFARRYPHGFTFMSDQELAMLADVAAASGGKGNALWGCDQAFGASHVLDRLVALLPPGDGRAYATRMRDWAARKEASRDLARYHFMAAEPKSDSLAQLAAAVHAAPGGEADFLIQSLIVSDRIYRSYREGRYYDNGYEREEYMKSRLLDEYRRALAADGRPPKVIVKFGHWHVFRGVGPSNLQTLGDFASEFAVVNDSRSFHVAIFPDNPPGGYGDLAAWPDHTPRLLAAAAAPTAWTIVDLRPLRTVSARVTRNLTPEERDNFRRWVYGFDAALFIGGIHRASYTLNPGVAY